MQTPFKKKSKIPVKSYADNGKIALNWVSGGKIMEGKK